MSIWSPFKALGNIGKVFFEDILNRVGNVSVFALSTI